MKNLFYLQQIKNEQELHETLVCLFDIFYVAKHLSPICVVR